MSYDRYRRRQSTFGALFSGTSGFLAAVFLFGIGGPIALCAGCGVWATWIAQNARERTAQEDARTGNTEKRALEALRSHGIVELSKDVVIDKSGPSRGVSGPAKGSDGQIHEVEVLFRVTEFANEIRWEVESITIDGEVKEGAKPRSGTQ